MKLNLVTVPVISLNIEIDKLDPYEHYIGTEDARGKRGFVAGNSDLVSYKPCPPYRIHSAFRVTSGSGWDDYRQSTLTECVRSWLADGNAVHVWTTPQELFAWLAESK